MSCSFDFVRRILHERFGASSAFNAKSNELTEQQDMFCFNHVSAFYMSSNIVISVAEWQIQGKDHNRKSYRTFTLPFVSVTCLSKSCSLGQSAVSIESRCVVMEDNSRDYPHERKSFGYTPWHGNAFRITVPLWAWTICHSKIPLTKFQ